MKHLSLFKDFYKVERIYEDKSEFVSEFDMIKS